MRYVGVSLDSDMVSINLIYFVVLTVLFNFSVVCNILCMSVCFQGEGVKNSLGRGDEAQVTSEARTRSVRSLGTAELIRPQKLKYFESMCHLTSFSFSSFLLLQPNFISWCLY